MLPALFSCFRSISKRYNSLFGPLLERCRQVGNRKMIRLRLAGQAAFIVEAGRELRRRYGRFLSGWERMCRLLWPEAETAFSGAK